VALNLRKPSLPLWVPLAPVRGSPPNIRREVGAATASAGLRAASAASFSICLGVGMRQLAGGSVMAGLEHIENKTNVESSKFGLEKVILFAKRCCRN
jgi:hypothetical protein